jgi:hypothetical protein
MRWNHNNLVPLSVRHRCSYVSHWVRKSCFRYVLYVRGLVLPWISHSTQREHLLCQLEMASSVNQSWTFVEKTARQPPEVIAGFCDAPDSLVAGGCQTVNCPARLLAIVGLSRSSAICNSSSCVRQRCSSASSP